MEDDWCRYADPCTPAAVFVFLLSASQEATVVRYLAFSFENSDMCWTFAKMSGKRRTLWRGSLELSEDEELDIAVATHQPSLRGQETFDWKIKNDEVCLTFEEIWDWQQISGQLSSPAPELPFQTKRLEDVPPGKLAGWGAIMFICMISSSFFSIS